MPPQHKELKDFENGLLELIKNVTFRKTYNNFYDQKDKSIRKSNNVINFVDKTRNLYETGKENYIKPLTENITKTKERLLIRSIVTLTRKTINNYEIHLFFCKKPVYKKLEVGAP